MTRAIPPPPNAGPERAARDGRATLASPPERERFSPSEAPRAGDEAEPTHAVGVLDELGARWDPDAPGA